MAFHPSSAHSLPRKKAQVIPIWGRFLSLRAGLPLGKIMADRVAKAALSAAREELPSSKHISYTPTLRPALVLDALHYTQ